MVSITRISSQQTYVSLKTECFAQGLYWGQAPSHDRRVISDPDPRPNAKQSTELVVAQKISSRYFRKARLLEDREISTPFRTGSSGLPLKGFFSPLGSF